MNTRTLISKIRCFESKVLLWLHPWRLAILCCIIGLGTTAAFFALTYLAYSGHIPVVIETALWIRWIILAIILLLFPKFVLPTYSQWRQYRLALYTDILDKELALRRSSLEQTQEQLRLLNYVEKISQNLDFCVNSIETWANKIVPSFAEHLIARREKHEDGLISEVRFTKKTITVSIHCVSSKRVHADILAEKMAPVCAAACSKYGLSWTLAVVDRGG